MNLRRKVDQVEDICFEEGQIFKNQFRTVAAGAALILYRRLIHMITITHGTIVPIKLRE